MIYKKKVNWNPNLDMYCIPKLNQNNELNREVYKLFKEIIMFSLENSCFKVDFCSSSEKLKLMEFTQVDSATVIIKRTAQLN